MKTMLRKINLISGVVNQFRCARRNFVLTSAKKNDLNKDDDVYEGETAESLQKLLDDASTLEDKNDEWLTTPYPETAFTGKNTDDAEKKPKIEASRTSVFLFPGQGTLKVGKINEYMRYPRVQQMFSIANEILGYDLQKICERGPKNVLDRTEHNQPATVLTSLAAVEKLTDERPRAVDTCVSVAGYSVGEITALIFAGAISFEDGIKLVGVRAAAMQEASDISDQGMMSVYCMPSVKLGTVLADAERWATNVGDPQPACRVAIYMYTQCKVLAGSMEALKYIQKNGPELGLSRIKMLPVSGAFHTPLMRPAVMPFKNALKAITVGEPVIPVYSNNTGEPYKLSHIKDGLAQQLVKPVKWEQIMHKIYRRPPGSEFPRTFDIGSTGAMKYILRQVNARAWEFSYVV